MYLYGASGHAKVVMDILDAIGVRVEGLVDDNPEVKELMGVPVYREADGLSPMIISIGNCAVRKKIAEGLKCEFGKAIHPTAIISKTATIDEGSVVMQGAIIQTQAKIGKHCIVNSGASIDHECVIGDYCHIAPHATLCGCVQVGEGTWVGAGATIVQGIHIGKNCMIGAGATVIKDVPDGVTVVGTPARIINSKN